MKNRSLLDSLELDQEKEIDRLCRFIREQLRALRREGIVLGLSGGVDSAVTAALAAHSVGAERVSAYILPERESHPLSVECAVKQAENLGIQAKIIDITGVLEAFGTYQKRDDVVKSIFHEYDETCRFNYFTLELMDRRGCRRSRRLNNRQLKDIVAATNTKQRTRMIYLYYFAEKTNRLVCGTTNKTEIIQGYFVKYGDGGVDIEPLAHLYKTQVYQLAQALGVIPEIIDRTPTPDTFSDPVSDEDFFFRMPYPVLDLLLSAWEKKIPIPEISAALRLTEDQIKRAFRDFDGKFDASAHLRQLPPTPKNTKTQAD
jgi:NAD+ synthase